MLNFTKSLRSKNLLQLTLKPLAILLSLLTALSQVSSATPSPYSRCSIPASPITVPDNNFSGVSDEIDFAVANYGNISQLEVYLRIDHNYVGDMEATLTHVTTGTQITLFSRIPYPASGAVGTCGANNLDVMLGQSGAQSIQDVCPTSDPTTTFPVSGYTYAPAESLATFNGETLSGLWRLTVKDREPPDAGSLIGWCLVHEKASLETPVVLSESTIAAGRTLNITGSLTNNGSLDALNPKVIFVVPSTLSFISGIATGGSVEYDSETRTVSASYSSILNGQTANYTLSLKPTNPPPSMAVVSVTSPSAIAYVYQGTHALFGPDITSTIVQGEVALANDGSGSPSLACSPLTNSSEVNGRIAIVDRGTCLFTVKVKNVQDAGGIGVIVVNTPSGLISTLGGTDDTITIPSVMISNSDGQLLKDNLSLGVSAKLLYDKPNHHWVSPLSFTPLSDTPPATNTSYSTMLTILADSDDDGTEDSLDGCPNDAAKTAPGACGCGTSDADSDSDGVLNCNEQCPLDPLKTLPGTCGCGIADTDSDADGTLNCNDQCPVDAAKTTPGVCGCNTADTDSDSDGTANCNDQCPLDAVKTLPGTCGCGVADTDANSNGVVDCLYSSEATRITRDMANVLARIKPARTTAQRNALRTNTRTVNALITQLKTLVNGHASAISFRGGNIGSNTTALIKSLREALKTTSSKYAKNMKDAKKKLSQYRSKLA